MMTTTNPKPFAVYARIDFNGRDPRNPKRPAYKIGRGNAGYTTVHFATMDEAKRYADALPEYARMPNHGAFDTRS